MDSPVDVHRPEETENRDPEYEQDDIPGEEDRSREGAEDDREDGIDQSCDGAEDADCSCEALQRHKSAYGSG